jgi:hypothetical protein
MVTEADAMSFNPRCPECDIELDISSDVWVCPLCDQKPGFPTVTLGAAKVSGASLRLRDIATEAATLIEAIVQDEPLLGKYLGDAYRLALDIAERADQDAMIYRTGKR